MIPVERKGYVCGGILVVVIFVLAAANLLLGSVDIPAGAVWGALTGGTVENEAWSFIVWESRVPLCVTAWCCGAALAASGLMLQTVFNNPLADPSILGISSGASLGVALVMLAGTLPVCSACAISSRISPRVVSTSTPRTSLRLELASASTTRMGPFFCLHR